MPLVVLKVNGREMITVGDLPQTMWEMEQLRELGLIGIHLTHIPSGIGRLTNVQELSLDYNRLTSVPSSLGQLTALQTLHLSNNSATGYLGDTRNFRRALLRLRANFRYRLYSLL